MKEKHAVLIESLLDWFEGQDIVLINAEDPLEIKTGGKERVCSLNETNPDYIIDCVAEGNIESTCIKNSRVKYYFVVINIKSGEQEFSSLSLHRINTNKKSVKGYFDEYAKEFYMNPDETKKDNDRYFWDVLSWEYEKQQEITEAEYYFLSKFI
jgi:hypothetical protein